MNRVSEESGYRELKDQLTALIGWAFTGDRNKLLAELIEARLLTLGLRNCVSYNEFIASGAAGNAEMDLLVARLTIGETYFFRDENQISAIREVILPDILDRKRASKELRIWSAGCATGAEPYSLAIILANELADQIAGWEIHIYASDLNQSYLDQAARGQFRAWALRSTSDQVKRECFTNKGLTWTLHPRYKEWISFHHMNLAGSEFSAPFATTHFDLILCRNVMIYLTPEANQRLIRQFHDRLEDGGWLVVGASEYSQAYSSAFRIVTAKEARVYQKVEDLPAQIVAMPEPAPMVSAMPEVLPPRLAQTPRRIAQLPQPPVSPKQVDALGLVELADHGDWQAAVACGQGLLAQDPLNPTIHFYQALILENLGIRDQSERSLRQAIYLDRNFALAHYHLGLALKRERQVAAAKRSFGNVLRVLRNLPADDIVTAGPGVTVTALKGLATMHLQNSGNAEEATV